RAAEISVRAQHCPAAGRDPLHARRPGAVAAAGPRNRRLRFGSERARELARGRRPHPPGLQSRSAQRRNRRMARGEPSARNQGSTQAGAARGGRAERLATSSLQRTLEELRLLAAIRGDSTEAALLCRAAAIALERGISTEGDLQPLFEAAANEADAAAI